MKVIIVNDGINKDQFDDQIGVCGMDGERTIALYNENSVYERKFSKVLEDIPNPISFCFMRTACFGVNIRDIIEEISAYDGVNENTKLIIFTSVFSDIRSRFKDNDISDKDIENYMSMGYKCLKISNFKRPDQVICNIDMDDQNSLYFARNVLESQNGDTIIFNKESFDLVYDAASDI